MAKQEKIYIDFVSKDKDWRSAVDNELKCQENWHNEWGFLADNKESDIPMTKTEKMQMIEEQLKKMKDVKLTSTMKQSFKGGNYDLKISGNNKRKVTELQPQPRRPKAVSKAHAFKLEKLGADYDKVKQD